MWLKVSSRPCQYSQLSACFVSTNRDWSLDCCNFKLALTIRLTMHGHACRLWPRHDHGDVMAQLHMQVKCHEHTKPPTGVAEHKHVCCAASWSSNVFAGYAAACRSFINTSMMLLHLATLSMWMEK